MSETSLRARIFTLNISRNNRGILVANKKDNEFCRGPSVITPLSSLCAAYMTVSLSDLCWAVLRIKAPTDEY
jgi:hypothetical protein